MGHYGDVVWGAKIEERFLTDELKRGAMSGLGLPEMGLKGRFFRDGGKSW
jgi:hypothetical protein